MDKKGVIYILTNPSKKQIVLQALKDLGENVDDGLTLYQLEHRLEMKVLQQKD